MKYWDRSGSTQPLNYPIITVDVPIKICWLLSSPSSPISHGWIKNLSLTSYHPPPSTQICPYSHLQRMFCCYLPTYLCDWISEGHSEQSTLSLNFSLGPTEAVHPDAVNWFGKLEYAFNIWIEIDTLNRRPSPLSIPLTSYHPIESISLFIAVPFDFLPSLFHCSTMRSPLIWISEHFAHRWWWQSNGQRYTEKLSRSAVDWMMRSLSISTSV